MGEEMSGARYPPAVWVSRRSPFLSGLDWSVERIGAEVKEDTEDTEDTEIVENIEDTGGMKDMGDMEDTGCGGRGGHGSRGGQEGSTINNIVILCNIVMTLPINIVCCNDL